MNFCHTCHSLYIRSNFYALCVLYTQHTVQKSTAHNKAVKSFSVTVFLRLLYYYYHRHHHYLFFGTILLPLPYFQVFFFSSFSGTPYSLVHSFSPLIHPPRPHPPNLLISFALLKSQPYSLSWLACKLNTKFGQTASLLSLSP